MSAGNVIPIREGVQPASPEKDEALEPQRYVVKTLRELTEMAETGRIRAIAVVFRETKDTGTTIAGEQWAMESYAMIGAAQKVATKLATGNLEFDDEDGDEDDAS